MEDTEAVWIQQAQAGDQSAFTRMVEAYQTPVYNLAYRMLGNSVEAENAAQETFIRMYTKLDTYDPKRKFSSWLLAIASHYCVDVLRRRRMNYLSLDDLPPMIELSMPKTVQPEQVVDFPALPVGQGCVPVPCVSRDAVFPGHPEVLGHRTLPE